MWDWAFQDIIFALSFLVIVMIDDREDTHNIMTCFHSRAHLVFRVLLPFLGLCPRSLSDRWDRICEICVSWIPMHSSTSFATLDHATKAITLTPVHQQSPSYISPILQAASRSQSSSDYRSSCIFVPTGGLLFLYLKRRRFVRDQ